MWAAPCHKLCYVHVARRMRRKRASLPAVVYRIGFSLLLHIFCLSGPAELPRRSPTATLCPCTSTLLVCCNGEFHDSLQIWIDDICRSDKDALLGVQTFRNGIMATTLLSAASSVLATFMLGVALDSDKLARVEEITRDDPLIRSGDEGRRIRSLAPRPSLHRTTHVGLSLLPLLKCGGCAMRWPVGIHHVHGCYELRSGASAMQVRAHRVQWMAMISRLDAVASCWLPTGHAPMCNPADRLQAVQLQQRPCAIVP